jgi:hypothetical protein
MAVHLKPDSTGKVYFIVTCDACRRVFTCYDQACYSFESLRTEAVFAGWDAPARPEQRCFCPDCLNLRSRGSDGRQHAGKTG